jgi:hypothetical protein
MERNKHSGERCKDQFHQGDVEKSGGFRQRDPPMVLTTATSADWSLKKPQQPRLTLRLVFAAHMLLQFSV